MVSLSSKLVLPCLKRRTKWKPSNLCFNNWCCVSNSSSRPFSKGAFLDSVSASGHCAAHQVLPQSQSHCCSCLRVRRRTSMDKCINLMCVYACKCMYSGYTLFGDWLVPEFQLYPFNCKDTCELKIQPFQPLIHNGSLSDLWPISCLGTGSCTFKISAFQLARRTWNVLCLYGPYGPFTLCDGRSVNTTSPFWGPVFTRQHLGWRPLFL